MIWLWLVLGLVGLGALFYWQFIIAEGAYLGSRVVAWTYDLVASRYDAIKRFEPHYENWFIATPLLEALAGVEQPLILDVATGTGRLPVALLRQRFRGRIIGLDLSRGMLRQARAKLRPYRQQTSLIRQDAARLPFGDATFDAVTCLESLEFMSRPLDVLAEMVRVLTPGGILFITNRTGAEARLLPGRVWPRSALAQALAELSLEQIEIEPWQVHYELVMGRKRALSVERAGKSASLASQGSLGLAGGPL